MKSQGGNWLPCWRLGRLEGQSFLLRDSLARLKKAVNINWQNDVCICHNGWLPLITMWIKNFIDSDINIESKTSCYVIRHFISRIPTPYLWPWFRSSHARAERFSSNSETVSLPAVSVKWAENGSILSTVFELSISLIWMPSGYQSITRTILQMK